MAEENMVEQKPDTTTSNPVDSLLEGTGVPAQPETTALPSTAEAQAEADTSKQWNDTVKKKQQQLKQNFGNLPRS